VTNDFPPKVGGIQVVQHELFGALDPDRVCVLAADHPDAAAYDATLPFRVERVRAATLLPSPSVARRVGALCDEIHPDVVVFGSALPVSLLRTVVDSRRIPYVTMVYGADVSVPARLMPFSAMLRRVLTGASGIVALGPFVSAEAVRACGHRAPPPVLEVFPGVDTDRFVPGEAAPARRRLGLDPARPTVTSVSRLVPRKGMHLLVEAAGRLVRDFADLQVVIAGSGREAGRIRRLVEAKRLTGNVRLLGRIDDASLCDLYQAGDVFTMLCHDRWGGLEAEGFGIVFVEAAACGRPVVAGRSGGATDAVADGVTATVVDAVDTAAVAAAVAAYLRDPDLAARHGAAGRARAVETFRWPVQAARFREWIQEFFGT